MTTAIAQELFTAQTAAERIGVTDARIRQLCIEHKNIGRKHGVAWLLTEADIVRIENLPDLRRKSDS